MEMNKDTLMLIILKELQQGQEIANQLRNNLDPLLLSSNQTCQELLVQKLLSSFDKALSMLKPHPKSFSSSSTEPPAPPDVRSQGGVAAKCSPKSEVCDSNKDVSKRRKTVARWIEQVRICSASGLEGPGDDGHSWRKYGQKDILGAQHPRGYYRCTHRHAQGCLARKQVQKSDQDPSIFEITYRGRHTCTQYSHFTPPKLSDLEIEAPKKQEQEPIQKQGTDQEEEKPQHPFPIIAGLTVKTEDLDNRANANIFPSFSFACPPPQILDDYMIFDDALVNNFIFPSTSDSEYFSPCNVANFRIGQNSDSDLTDILSAPNSIANSPIGELDLTIESLEDIDPSFLFS